MFRLEGVIIRLPLKTIFKVCKVTVHIWDPKGISRVLLKQCYSVQWRTQEFCSGGSTNSVKDRGQRERGSGGSVVPQSEVLEAVVIWYKKFHFL